MNSKSIKLFFILLFATTSFAFSQTATSKEFLTSEWQLLQESEGVKFFVKKVDCAVTGFPKPLIFTYMKIENTTDKALKVNFNFGLQYFEGCSGCENNSESAVYFELAPKTSIEGDCEMKNTSLARLILNPNLKGGYEFQKPVITSLSID